MGDPTIAFHKCEASESMLSGRLRPARDMKFITRIFVMVKSAHRYVSDNGDDEG